MNVTNRGFEYITQWMSGATPSNYTYPTFIGWGGANGYNTSATSPALPATAPSSTIGTGQWSDVAPYQEFSEARTAGTVTIVNNTTNTTGSVYNGTISTQIVGTITASTGENVAESFLSFSSTKNAAFTLTVAVTAATQGQQTTGVTVSTSGATVGGYYQMNNEVVYVGTVTSNTVLTITRAVNGSSGNTAKSGDVITNGNPPGYGPSNPNHGDMFAHAGFSQLVLNSGDSVAFTWTVNVTS